MTRLWLDENFSLHPRLEGWKPAEKWALVELLLYCARTESSRVPGDASLLPRGVTPAVLEHAERSGWLERRGNGALHVHNWEVYNGSNVAERVAAYLSGHPEASANEVHRHVPGRRTEVLAAVRELRPEGGN